MTRRKIKNILINRYNLYLSNKFTAGHRAAEYHGILTLAAENEVVLPLEVSVGCKFFVSLDRKVQPETRERRAA